MTFSSTPQGTHDRLKLYLMADAYVGADRELEIPSLEVAEGEDSDDNEDEDESEDGEAAGGGGEDTEMAEA